MEIYYVSYLRYYIMYSLVLSPFSLLPSRNALAISMYHVHVIVGTILSHKNLITITKMMPKIAKLIQTPN